MSDKINAAEPRWTDEIMKSLAEGVEMRLNSLLDRLWDLIHSIESHEKKWEK